MAGDNPVSRPIIMDPFQEFQNLNDKKAQQDLDAVKHGENQLASLQTQETIVQSFKSLVDYLDNKVTKTEVINQLHEIGTPDALHVVNAVNALHETLKTHENVDLSEMTGVLRELLDETKQIPKESVEIPEPEAPVDYSKNFEGLTKAVQGVEKVVKAQKLIAEAPIVHVKAPEVNVDAPDLSSLKDGQKEIVEAVRDIVIPDAPDNSGVEKLLKKLDKRLEKLPDLMPRGRGGGGSGRATPYQDSNAVPAFVTLTSGGAVPVTSYANQTVKFAAVSVSSSGDNTIVSAVALKKLKVLSAVLVAAGTVSVKWRSNSTDLTGAMPLVVNSGFVLPSATVGGHYFEAATGEALKLNLSGNILVAGHISYYEEA